MINPDILPRQNLKSRIRCASLPAAPKADLRKPLWAKVCAGEGGLFWAGKFAGVGLRGKRGFAHVRKILPAAARIL
ncbi:MAG: hypothetical protein DBY30_09560 [Verrucomicrobia bacterium]|nr:MAG: hypothetical protein DBY30_09560 [Verrucomicrobiota bacterium]